LRLVKTTVNFDNPFVYHFYYGDTHGTPGTIWTTFPYKGHGVPPGRRGSGQVVTTSFSVPHGALAFWRTRLAQHSIAVTDVEQRFGEAAVAFADDSGLEFEIVGSAHDSRAPWVVGEIDTADAIRGLHSVTLVVREAEPTLAFMAQLGWTVAGQDGGRIRTIANGGGPGRTIDVVVDPDRPAGANGIGTVHHVAMAIDSAEAQLALRETLLAQGVRVTEVRDRYYFTSIYFREPGGVLFEVATLAPGFAVDEASEQLGTSLKLPPTEEANRAGIERALPSIAIPRPR
jgi:glyoxalase family protein